MEACTEKSFSRFTLNIEKKIYFFLFTLIFAFVVWSGPKILVGNINAFHESDYATSISNDTVDNDLISDNKDINALQTMIEFQVTKLSLT